MPPPPSAERDDGRTSYDTGFKTKARTTTGDASLDDLRNGQPVPLAWAETLGTLYTANKHLGTGSLAISSLVAMAKSYPRALLLHGDSLMCCKVDGMDLCVFKWDKRLLSLLGIKRVEKTAFSLSSTTEVVLAFDEIDVETGVNFEEIFSFTKERDAIRFVADVEDAKRKARASRAEAIEAAHLEQEAKRKASHSSQVSAYGALPPVLPLHPALPAHSVPAPASSFDPFRSAPPPPPPVHPVSSSPASSYDPFTSAPPPPPPVHPAAGPSAAMTMPAAVPFDPFSTPPLAASAAPSFNLLDGLQEAPHPLVDPFGFTLADPVVAQTDPFAASSMAPLAAALPRTPATSGTRPRLGEAPKAPKDPFANLMDL